MNQYAGALIVCVCLGAVAAIGAGCDSGSSGGSGGATGGAGAPVGGAGAPVGVAGAPVGGAGAPVGVAGAPVGVAGAPSGGGSSGTGTEVPLPSSATGFVSVVALGIQGPWYSYGDGQGSDGMVADSDCVLKGMHMASDCSMITAPLPGSFAPTDALTSKMCTAGTAAKVIAGSVGCTAPATTCPDYTNLFGAGIALDLNNAGVDGGTGMKMPFNATAAGIIGVAFDIDMLPAGGMRVEFPTTTTPTTSAVWKPTGTANTSPLVVGHNVLLFADVKSPSFVKPAIPFDPTTLDSVQFHVPTSTTAAAPYSFCISNFAAVTSM